MRQMFVLVFVVLVLGGSLSAQSYGVSTSDATVRISSFPPLPPQFDLSSVPQQARQQLLPLYQQEYALLQELSSVKWQALRDTLGGLTNFADAYGSPTAAARVVEESAARSGQYGARSGGNFSDPHEPAEMYESVNRAMQLLVQIDRVDKEISSVQKANGIGATLRTPWASLFQGTGRLTPAEVYKLLAPAAKDAAKPVAGIGAGTDSSAQCGKVLDDAAAVLADKDKNAANIIANAQQHLAEILASPYISAAAKAEAQRDTAIIVQATKRDTAGIHAGVARDTEGLAKSSGCSDQDLLKARSLKASPIQ